MADNDHPRSKSYIKWPTNFNGTDWESFLLQVILYIDVQEKDFPSDKIKIVFVVLCMTQDPVKSFADFICKEALYDLNTGKIQSASIFSI